MTTPVTLQAAAVSDVGQVRQINEDSVYLGRRLYAVADGLGGHAAGEIASAAVIATLSAYDTETDPAALLEVLARAVADANAEVARRLAEDPARAGMGTTLTALLQAGDQAALVNIGDSRAFRLRDGQLRQLTEDHVLGNLVSNAGAMAPVLVRYLDGRPDRSLDLGLRQLQPGDRYLLCTDGLSPVVSTEAIRGALTAAGDPREAVGQLADLADEAGAPDNISAIVIDVREGGEEPGAPVMLGAAAAVLTS